MVVPVRVSLVPVEVLPLERTAVVESGRRMHSNLVAVTVVSTLLTIKAESVNETAASKTARQQPDTSLWKANTY